MKSQTKIIAISLFGLVVSFGLFLTVIKPTMSKVNELKKEAITKKTELKQLEEQITIFKNSQVDLAKASGKEIIAESLLDREVLQLAIEKVESAALATNVLESMVIVDELEPTTGTISEKPLISGKSLLTEVPYTLSTTSDFMQLINFLRYLEHLPHFTEVSKITLQALPGTSDTDGVFTHSDTVIGSIESIFFIQKK